MADGLDTIAPPSPKFFRRVANDPLLERSAREALLKRAVEGHLSLDDARTRIVSNQQKIKLTDLRIESAEFELATLRDKASREQASFKKATEVGAEFEAILDDVHMSQAQKAQAIKKVRLRESDAFTNSPHLQNKFKAALETLPAPMTAAEVRLTKQFELAQQERQRRIKQEGEEDVAKKALAEVKADTEIFQEEVKFIESLKFNEDDMLGGDVDTDALVDPSALERVEGFIADFAPRFDFEVPDARGMSHRARRAVALQLARLVRSELNNRRRKLGAVKKEARQTDPLGIPVE